MNSDDEQGIAAPVITLPKGGSTIRGMGEKSAANPACGTGSMSVLIAISPGRADFGPLLSLSYGAGNSPFGSGWSLTLPSNTCKTDKGLPLYHEMALSYPAPKTKCPPWTATDSARRYLFEW